MTDSGYPRTVHEWRRGTPLSEATKVYEGEKSDVAVSGYACLRGDDSGCDRKPRLRIGAESTTEHSGGPPSA